MPKTLPENIVSVLTNCFSAVWISCCKEDNRPIAARLSSVRMVDNETICCYIPDKFAVKLLPYLVKNSQVAVMAACTETLDSYQVKGYIDRIFKAGSEEITGQKHTLELFSNALVRLGFSADAFFKAYDDDAFTGLEIKVEDLFDQTPRPGTGSKINI